jgi:hypothetical protein
VAVGFEKSEIKATTVVNSLILCKQAKIEMKKSRPEAAFALRRGRLFVIA